MMLWPLNAIIVDTAKVREMDYFSISNRLIEIELEKPAESVKLASERKEHKRPVNFIGILARLQWYLPIFTASKFSDRSLIYN